MFSGSRRLAAVATVAKKRGRSHRESAIISLLIPEATPTPPKRPSFRFSKRQAIALVAACTVFSACAQVLFKFGANSLENFSLTGLADNPLMVIDVLTEPPLFAGYCLYALFTALLTLALRDGELSVLYPVIALTYVWVTILSVLIFRESMTGLKLAGIALIVTGVATLGRNGDR